MKVNRHLSSYIAISLFILFSGGLIPSAWSATIAGKVAIVRGKVTAVAEDGQTRTLAAKAPIYVNDTISTEANSQAQILFNDETIYTLGPQSDLKIDQFVYDPRKGVGDLVVGATKGSFRMITGSIAKKTPERVKVKTPVATIGIRGTYLAGTFNGAALNALLVGGAIVLENQGGVKNITTPGFGSVVKSGSAAPEPPRKFTPQEVKQVLAPTEIKGAPAPVAPQAGGSAPAPSGDQNASQPAGTKTAAATGGTNSTTPSTDPNAPAPAPAPTGDPNAPKPAGTATTSSTGGTPPTGDPTAPPPGGTTAIAPPPTNTTISPPPGGTTTMTTLEPKIIMPPPPPPLYPLQPIQPIIQPFMTFCNCPPPPLDINQIVSDQTYADLTGRYLTKDGGIASGTLTGSATGNNRTYMLSRGGWGNEPLNMAGPVIDLTQNPFSSTGPYNYPGQTLWGIGYPGGFSEYDGRSEFAYFESSAGNLLLGYAGRPSIAALPTSGIGVYKGITGFVSSIGAQSASDMVLFVNWSTGKVFASFSENATTQTYYAGTVDTANKQLTGSVVGKDYAGAPNDFHVSTSPYIFNFYGGMNQGIGGTGSGSDRDYLNTPGPTFNALAAGVGNPVQYNLVRPATETYMGFVAAISVPRGFNGDLDHVMLLNSNPNDVTLDLNRVNGVLSGTVGGSFNNLTGQSRQTARVHTINSTFAPAGSFYIDDDAFVNPSVNSSGNVTTVGPANATTNVSGGNFVVTNPNLWNPIPYDHLTWGYWASEYTAGGTVYNVTPGSYWIAGLLTQNVNLPAAGTGTYSGSAMGQAYNSSSQQFYPLKGTSNLTADFGARSLTGTLNMSSESGAPNRMDWTINLNGSWPAATNVITGFGPSGAVGSVTPYAGGVAGPSTAVVGSMNGAFFDTNAGSAKAVGGNWQSSGGNHYATGIFVGK